MVTNNNSNLSNEIIQASRIQVGKDKLPSEFSDKVVFTCETNPKLIKYPNICKYAVANNATSATIYTVPADRDFCITSYTLSVVKDVTATSTESAIKCQVDSATAQRIAAIATLTLTAERGQISGNFIPPLKIDKGSGITVTNSTNTSNITAEGTITGYLLDNNQA